jgi:surface carbohydrate biosynthesis protein
MIKFLKRLIKIKLVFQIPQKKNILIYDNEGSNFITEVLDKDSYGILHARGENLNLYIYLKLLLRLRFNYKDYLNEYIKFVSPKALITWIDNNLNFYEYKGQRIKKIAIQNARRTAIDNDLFSNLNKKKDNRSKYKADYIFAHSASVKKTYEQFIDAKVYATGSFRSNNEKIKFSKKKNDILFISTFRNAQLGNEKRIIIKDHNGNDYKLHNWIAHELRLLKWLKLYSLTYKRQISVLGAQIDEKNEINFFKKNLGLKFNFIKKTKDRKTYKILDESRLIVGIDSTLLNEAFGRGCNVAFLSYRGNAYPLNTRKCGWPENFSMNGKFWTRNPDYKSFKDVMNFYNSKTTTVSTNLRKKIMVFDEGNKKFKSVLREILIN